MQGDADVHVAGVQAGECVMEMVGRFFSLREATCSDAAARLGLDNTPSTLQHENIKYAAARLDLVRECAGPLIVSSWFRSPAVNKAVGGAATSAHMSGWAIDCRSESMSALDLCKTAAACLRSRSTAWDQIIHEYGQWMHISFDPHGRGELLTIFDANKKYVRGLLTRQEYYG